MIKYWLDMWKKTFHYTGTVTRKGYWLALTMNVIVMYLLALPYALLAMMLTDNVPVIIAVYMIVLHIPAVSIYFRRARDAGWKTGTAVYMAITIPVVSGLIVGLIDNCRNVSKGRSFLAKIFALSFGLSFYGSVISFALYDDPTAIPFMPIAGIFLGSLVLIGYGIVHRKEVLAFLSGS